MEGEEETIEILDGRKELDMIYKEFRTEIDRLDGELQELKKKLEEHKHCDGAVVLPMKR